MLDNQIKAGAFLSYLTLGINILIGIIYTPWMIHSIGNANYGLFTLAMSVINIFVFDFGLSTSTTRFIARYLAEGRQDKADNCLGLVYRLYLCIDIFLMVIMLSVYFFIPFIYRELSPDEIEKFKVIYAIAAIYSVISFPFIPVNGVLSAHEKFIQLKFCELFGKLFVVGSMTICLIFGYGLYSLVLANALSGILTICTKLFCILKYSRQKITWNYYDKAELKQILSYSGWVTVIALSQRCIFSLAPSILGIFSGSSAIAVLGIAITLEAYTYTFANAINGLFLPRVARIVANESGNVQPLMTKVGRIQIFIIGLIVFGFLCFGKDFVSLWVGDSFSMSYICAILIIFPSFLYLPQQIGNDAIYASNKVKKLAVVFLTMATINLIGAFILAPILGAMGVCISICIAYLIRTIGMDIIFYKDLNINVFDFFRNTYFSTFLPLLLSVSLGCLFSHFIPIDNWVGLGLKVFLFACVYIGVMYNCAFTKEEKQLSTRAFTCHKKR